VVGPKETPSSIESGGYWLTGEAGCKKKRSAESFTGTIWVSAICKTDTKTRGGRIEGTREGYEEKRISSMLRGGA